ncbi:MAG: hypothetical protein GXP56_09270 [Deltaproteobacteria bacterium]|nr:hypothetical protein [Deltaproteobacteria bacterium]
MKKISRCFLFGTVALAFLLLIFTAMAAAEEPIHKGYPFVFDQTGRLDRISNKDLVVDDVLYKLSSSTTYHAPDTIFTKFTSFKKGDFLGIILKGKNTREVLSVWLIKKAD